MSTRLREPAAPNNATYARSSSERSHARPSGFDAWSAVHFDAI